MASGTRSRILTTARGLFVRQGYAATSLRQVAKETGIAKATIYHHFPGKKAIMDELLGDAERSMALTLETLHGQKDPRARLETATREAHRFLAGHADLLQIARREVPGSREKLRASIGRFFHSYEALVAEAVSIGRREGSFRAVNDRQTARVFMAMLQGSFVQAMFGMSEPGAAGRPPTALLDIFFNGIAEKSAGRSHATHRPAH